MPQFWNLAVGDEKFDQWRENVKDILERFDESYGAEYYDAFSNIWRFVDVLEEVSGDVWQNEFWESSRLLNSIKFELLQSDRLVSLQPVFKNYIRLSSLSECSDKELARLIKGLEDICTAEDPSIANLARHGRIIAEECAERIYHHLEQHPSIPPIKRDFNDQVKAITSPLNRGNHGYIISYLKLLQSCGNTAGHAGKWELTLIDGHAILSASVRVLEYAGSL